ncbi:MAG TPA: class I SAM-dependent methyltransferase [Chloroflexota bacterium]|nr:class I SAM-dependent methyltransferase [Chloroflexota bacterium]
MATDPLLEEQIAYYRARAGEYDEWFLRQGRYDQGPELNARWRAELDEVVRALEAFGPHGAVLELAGGTGWWTERLAGTADALTVVDASPEVLAISRARLGGDPRVRYVEADLFAWRPDRRYDVVIFTYWLSHVPPARFGSFWAMVADCLAPTGRVFFVDNLAPSTTSSDHQPSHDGVTATRRLNDGRAFRIYKLYYQPNELAARLGRLGWAAEVRRTPSYFIYGSARPA